MRRLLFQAVVLLFTCCSARGQWVKCSPAYSDYGYNSIVSIGNYIVTICGGEIVRSTNLGDSWLPSENDPIDFYYLYNFHNRLFAMNDYGDSRVIYSDDSGASWHHVKGIYNSGTSMVGFHDTLLKVGIEVHRSLDSGLTWTLIPPSTVMPFGWDTVPWTVTYSSGALYAGGLNGMYRSRDGGSTWTCLLPIGGQYPNDTIVRSIAAIDSVIIVGTAVRSGTAHPTYTSRNQGVTWDTVPSFQFPVICSRVIDSIIYVGLGAGIMMSRDTGKTWSSILENMTADKISWIDTSFGYLFAAGNGIWRRPLNEIRSAVIEEPALKQSLTIYPNPTTASTTISITPEASGYADISIVNMLGQIVARVYSGVLDASEHTFTWEAQAKACASGVYECVVRMNGRVQTVPIVIE